MGRLRRHPLLLLGVALGLFGLLFAGAFAVGDSGVMALVPFAGLLIPLLVGRYVGAAQLDRLRRAVHGVRPRAPRRLLTVLPTERPPLLRGAQVMGSGLARRPPPASIATA